VDEVVWNDDEDDGNGDEDATIPCPHCGRPIYEESQRCPYCGDYISDEDAAAAHKPWWIIVGALLVFYVVYRWIAG
jgi:predicted nucleic acid-binding Zn ribbon protein